MRPRRIAEAFDYDRRVPLRRNAKIELLKAVPLFEHCSNKELAAIAAEADELELPAGRELATEGASGREFIVLVTGAADVRRKGRRINTLGDGDFLGEIALLTGAARSATVTSSSQCHLLVLTDRAFRRVTDAMPSVNEKVLQALAERLAHDAV